MLYDKLKNYSKSGIYPFHMPGHKRTDITEEGIIPYNIDITEIHDFDNLHSPNGAAACAARSWRGSPSYVRKAS